MTEQTNDNEMLPPTSSARPDPHGQAAMLLVESLIHSLVARSVIRIEDAIDLITVAIDVTIEITADLAVGECAEDRSLALLTAIRRSLIMDVK